MDDDPERRNNLRCRFGFHKWGETEFMFPIYSRKCKICDKKQSRSVLTTKWTDDFVVDNNELKIEENVDISNNKRG